MDSQFERAKITALCQWPPIRPLSTASRLANNPERPVLQLSASLLWCAYLGLRCVRYISFMPPSRYLSWAGCHCWWHRSWMGGGWGSCFKQWHYHLYLTLSHSRYGERSLVVQTSLDTVKSLTFCIFLCWLESFNELKSELQNFRAEAPQVWS